LGIYRRRAVLRRAVQCGADLSIGPGTLLTQSTVSLGNHVYIGSYCNVGNVEIGDGTLLADQVHIITGYHGIDRLDIPIKDQPTTQRRIKIGADSWIGSGAVVLADVGSHCVIGAGSVVTKPIADYAIAVGNPAKPIGDRRERAARSADDRADDRADSRAQ
jgi:acetyltransferase-like isoleucine patch superfamily enzyme